MGRFQRATTRLEAKGFQRRMDSRHRQLLPLKGKKDSLKQQWTEQRRFFYGYCSSKLHRSQDRHGLETKKKVFPLIRIWERRELCHVEEGSKSD